MINNTNRFFKDIFLEIGDIVDRAFRIWPEKYNLPNVRKAADLMGLRECDVRNMLASKNVPLIEDEYLSYFAVQFLADRFLEKLRSYSKKATCLMLGDFSSIESYENIIDIDYCLMRDVFVEDLTDGTILSEIVVFEPCMKNAGAGNTLRQITTSLLYHIKLKTKVFASCRAGTFVIAIILANHFHIFTSESDSNVVVDCYSGNVVFNRSRKAVLLPAAA